MLVLERDPKFSLGEDNNFAPSKRCEKRCKLFFLVFSTFMRNISSIYQLLQPFQLLIFSIFARETCHDFPTKNQKSNQINKDQPRSSFASCKKISILTAW
eukprot:Sdes_comp19797_c0_seq2m11891